MRIELRDLQRRPVGRVAVDPDGRPTRVTAELPASRFSKFRIGALWTRHKPAAPAASPREVFLLWDTAMDDAGQLRRCVACGCTDLFREKAFPQVTAVIVILAFIGAIVGAVGLASTPVLYVMLVVLLLDVAILILSRRRLVCYRCRSTFYDLPIARYHGSWDRAVADRHPLPRSVIETAATPSREVEPAPPPPAVVAPAEQTNYFASS